MGASTSEIVVVTDPAVFQSLQAEWDALWSEANGLHFQAFTVCLLCWTQVAQPLGRRLHCVVYRENGKLLLVWPLVSHRRLFWNVLDPLTPGTIEHTSMLVTEGPHKSRAIASAWEAACKRCSADLFIVPYVDTGTPLHEHASRHARIMAMSNDISMKVVFPRSMDWNTFCTGLGKLEKKLPGARYRRLAKEGDLVIRQLGMEDSNSFEKWIEWILTTKRDWASSRGKASTWLASPTYQRYLLALLNSADELSKAHLFIVTLDGEPIAANLIGMGKTSQTNLIGAFDKRYAKFEPGLLVREIEMERAFERGFDVDLGVGTERFKVYWSSNNVSPNESFEIATSPLGLLAFRIKHLLGTTRTWVRGQTSRKPSQPSPNT